MPRRCPNKPSATLDTSQMTEQIGSELGHGLVGNPWERYRKDSTRLAAPTGGFEQANVQWIEIDAPNSYKLVAAVFRPQRTGSFPVIVLLHSSAGFNGPFTRGFGDQFVESGFLVVAGTWFAGARPGLASRGLINWPQAPPFNGTTLDAIKYADVIVKTARVLLGADGKRVGLFGMSRGAMAAVLLASTRAGVQAVVADSADYVTRNPIDTSAIDLVKDLGSPLLMLNGTADETAPIQLPGGAATAGQTL